MTENIDPTFEQFVREELGDVAVASGGKYISPKIQTYYKVWTSARDLGVALGITATQPGRGPLLEALAAAENARTYPNEPEAAWALITQQHLATLAQAARTQLCVLPGLNNLVLQKEPLKTLEVLSLVTAYEQGVGKGHQAFNTGKEIENPYVPKSTHCTAWDYGYSEGKEQAERMKSNASGT